MKKILGLSIAAILVLGIVGVGTWALFSDTETSTGNILTAGTLDLKTNDLDGVSGTFTSTGMKPGDYIPSGGPATIGLRNAGSINATSLSISFGYVERDGAASDSDNLSAADFAAGLTITNLTYDNSDLLALINDTNVDGRKDMRELVAQSAALQNLPGLTAGQTKNFVIRVQFDPAADNTFQNDGIDVTVTFVLNQ